jgi:pheromone shutdown-related protein TraB
MLAAIRWAEAGDRALCLVDRDIQVTLKRTWGQLGLWGRLKMVFQLAASVFVGADVDESTIEKLKEEAELENVLESLARAFPSVKASLIDERDAYLAEKIRRAPGGRIVAVVGAGHVQGILRHIGAATDVAPLEEVPSPSLLPRILQWGIPIAIVALIGWGFYRSGVEESVTSIYVWLLVNGSLSALGAAVALGHPLTVASAFVAAPLTSLNPMIAAGWVAGLVQAWVKRPTVAHLEDLPEDIGSVRGFWRNPLSRILLVVALANLGSTLGTFVAASWIAARTL